ncbi:hypothetical protein [Microbulbifer epialgicus]|uniref:Abortive infection C-terminus n=1 Tax=Microbulbifer epialgicus TaxID=393907 RepID=A0ABV4NV55_9GAMM
MRENNPALNALNALRDLEDEEQTSTSTVSRPLTSIVNGINTCGPIVSALLLSDSNNIDSDIDEMLFAAKSLIQEVSSTLSIEVDDQILSAINAFCIKVVTENWKASQEVYEEWSSAIVQALTYTGISSEYSSYDFSMLSGYELVANIVASSEIFCILQSITSSIDHNHSYELSIKAVFDSVEKAIDKLSQFHIPYEDADLVRHHFTIQAGKIFAAVISCDFKLFESQQRLNAISDDKVSNEFQIGESIRRFSAEMDSFVTAIYVNSRMVN